MPGGAVLKPSDKIAEPDIQVGIPSALLAVEMSIFAVVHIFAFSYKPYDLRYNPGASYQGGFMGWKAILEAFNLWDVVKASARGFRWLFVGARKREQDISYAHHRASSEPVKLEQIQTGYQETGLTGGGRAGITDAFGKETGRPPLPPRRDTNDSDDRAALLSNTQNVPKINLQQPSPYGDELGSGHYREEPGQYQDGRGNWPLSSEENRPPGSRPYDTRR